MAESIWAEQHGCVFCTRHEQPASLFETSSLYVMPDKFPMFPGHTLIIAKQHLRCYAAASFGLLRELEEVAARIRRFLKDAYGTQVITTETGLAGQTVLHAHLHLLPVPMPALSVAISEHDDITPVGGWSSVRDYYARNGAYYYLELEGRRYLLPQYNSPLLREMRHVLAEATGLTYGKHGWEKKTTPEDVIAVGERCREWASDSPQR